MKYTLHINQALAIELGIKNINQAHIFDLLTTASTWAKPEIVGTEVYYWVARQNICTELALLNLKPDTVYRHLKGLNVLGLIDYEKVGKKDCIRITDLGRKYLLKNDEIHYVGNKSELNENSEINPNKLGNKSENDSEINPTYPTTNTNPTTKDTLLSSWNDLAGKCGLSKIMSITKSRQAKIKTREKDIKDFTTTFVLALGKIEKSKFLKGENNNGWKVTFDWLVENDSNIMKVIEGNYDNNKPNTFIIGDKDYTETEDF